MSGLILSSDQSPNTESTTSPQSPLARVHTYKTYRGDGADVSVPSSGSQLCVVLTTSTHTVVLARNYKIRLHDGGGQ